MRDVKFRGQSTQTGSWLYGSLIRRGDRCFILPFTGKMRAADTEVIPATVGQYTGLKDKNGKEIYEGDIFKTTDSNGCCLVVVEWDDVNARFLGRDQHRNIWYVGREPAAVIIGNIHDNPELLKNE